MPMGTFPKDLFDCWSSIPADATVHPADEPVFRRVASHGFNTHLLPGCFMGPLRTAPVVLLFLSPSEDEGDATTPELIKWHQRTRQGNEPLVSAFIHPPAYRWWMARTACFGLDPAVVAKKVAVLNIGAYHSRTFNDHGLLAALPSSRVSLDWAQATLFPAAERSERVVICLRAAKYWGLEAGKNDYPGTLFAPNVTRGGHIHRADRDRVVAAVKRKLS